jgi:septal ring factor EnvC (AmiA/AmiB activator)
LAEYPILKKIKEMETKLDQIEAHLKNIDHKLDEIHRDLP